MSNKISRRTVIGWGVYAPLSVGLSACGKGGNDASKSGLAVGDTSCVAAGEMSESEHSLRVSLQYIDASPDPQKECKDCAFFASTQIQNSCANCQMLKGLVHSHGHCNSWSAKA